MRLLLINPSNDLITMRRIKWNPWNRYHVWKPLNLLIIAALTPSHWRVTVIDENVAAPDYEKLPRPDLVGITAFTSQAPRAYALAGEFRKRGVAVVMGGIHATMCPDEAAQQVDAVVTGEAESVWGRLLCDFERGRLGQVYAGEPAAMEHIPPARHDLAPARYPLGAIQTARGCPLNCSFCSVTRFNGGRYRRRPIDVVVREFERVPEKRLFIVDDNLIGITREHVDECKQMLRAVVDADVHKEWVAQTTINFASDEELMDLAAQAGCVGVLIGFESHDSEGLLEVNKRFHARSATELRDAVQRIQQRGILVAGSFIIGFDVDEPGVGERIALTAIDYGLDVLDVNFLTPLPGTRLWDKLSAESRIVRNRFPDDWKYYTLTLPTAQSENLTWPQMVGEMHACYRTFYAYRQIGRRTMRNYHARRQPLRTLGINLSCRTGGLSFDRKVFAELGLSPAAMHGQG